MAEREAKRVGTKMVASEAGLGAGDSAAATFCTAESAITIITTATKSFIFMASIVKEFFELFVAEIIKSKREKERECEGKSEDRDERE
ncbi:unnamed protein product [Ilex paraguariensis]|uniref:Uncharacterized protein n=1 Tax=Ilex paraguariensis TaxID=185542 RepID=A0ABC8QVG8_9AQUA